MIGLLKYPPRPAGTLDWRHRAACQDADPELFFPWGGSGWTSEIFSRVQQAKAICRGCPVRRECLDWATQIGDRDAILGGLTPNERRRAVRR